MDKIERYKAMLWEENKIQNLFSRSMTEQQLALHIEDCVSAVNDITNLGSRWCDIGSGQGMPAIPLAIQVPRIEMIMIESETRKCEFLQRAVTELQLRNTYVVHGRIEDIGKQPAYRESFDVVTVRALAEMNVLVEWGVPLLKIQGTLIAWKGKSLEQEIAASKKALEIMGSKIELVRNYLLEEKERYLVFIKKERMTPEKYPRKGGTAKKNPL